MRRVQDLCPHYVHGAAGEGVKRQKSLEGLSMGRGSRKFSPCVVSLSRSISGASHPSGNRAVARAERSEVISLQHSGQKLSLVTLSHSLSPSPVQRGATPLGPPEAPDGEVPAVREGKQWP